MGGSSVYYFFSSERPYQATQLAVSKIIPIKTDEQRQLEAIFYKKETTAHSMEKVYLYFLD